MHPSTGKRKNQRKPLICLVLSCCPEGLTWGVFCDALEPSEKPRYYYHSYQPPGVAAPLTGAFSLPMGKCKKLERHDPSHAHTGAPANAPRVWYGTAPRKPRGRGGGLLLWCAPCRGSIAPAPGYSHSHPDRQANRQPQGEPVMSDSISSPASR